MPVRRSRRLAALAVAALLAAPTPAVGQSAGDDQYQDPFAGEEQSQTQEPAPTATPAPPEPTPAATAPAPAPAAPRAVPAELPRTGLDAGLVLAAGATLLTGGIALRLRVRGRV